jgi:hypothetical protein
VDEARRVVAALTDEAAPAPRGILMRIAIVMLAALALRVGAASAQAVSDTFAGRVVTFDVPVSHPVADRQRLGAAALFVAYRTAPRADCTSGLVLIVLVDLAATAGGDSLTLQQFAATNIGPLRKAHANWAVSESTMVLDDVPAIRYSWSGSLKPSRDCPARRRSPPERGVMIVGIKKGLGFTLQARDVEPHASETVPAGEAALLGFRVHSKGP